MVTLSILVELYNMRVHRLVVMKYLPNPMYYEQVNHKDGDKSNNHVNNLEWCSGAFNIRHGLLNGLIVSGENSPNAVLSDAEVSLIRLSVLKGESYNVV